MHTIAFISQIINAKQNRCLHKDHNGWAWLAKILLVDTFNKENVLVEDFSKIVKTLTNVR